MFKKLIFILLSISLSTGLNNHLYAMKRVSDLTNEKSPDYSTLSLNEKMKKMLEYVTTGINELSITKNTNPPIIVGEKPIEEKGATGEEIGQTLQVEEPPIVSHENHLGVSKEPIEEEDAFYEDGFWIEKEEEKERDSLIKEYGDCARKRFNEITKEFEISTICSPNNNANNSILNLLKVGILLFGKEITHLYIYGSGLSDSKSLEDLITESNLPNLETLLLSHNMLTSIHNLNLPKLRVLHLQNNKLGSLPDFRFLPNLRDLRIENNFLSYLPDFILPNLEFLWASENRIEEVANFTCLKKLRKLWLFGNHLKTLPNFDLPNLIHLWIFNNQITELPNFDQLPKLYELKATRNHFSEKPIFTHLTKCSIHC